MNFVLRYALNNILEWCDLVIAFFFPSKSISNRLLIPLSNTKKIDVLVIGDVRVNYHFNPYYLKFSCNHQNTSTSHLNEGDFPSTLFLVIGLW